MPDMREGFAKSPPCRFVKSPPSLALSSKTAYNEEKDLPRHVFHITRKTQHTAVSGRI